LFQVLAKKSLSAWILFSCIIAHIFIGFSPAVHTFPDYITMKCVWLAVEPFMHRFFQWLVASLDAVSSVSLVLPYPFADLLGLNKSFSQWTLTALFVSIPLRPADSFHAFVNLPCQWPNINEEIAFRMLLTGNMIT
jgi:hypothetical protein